jgi:hypothetical protein
MGEAPVAQLDRALPSEGKGHTFESCRVRQFDTIQNRNLSMTSRRSGIRVAFEKASARAEWRWVHSSQHDL